MTTRRKPKTLHDAQAELAAAKAEGELLKAELARNRARGERARAELERAQRRLAELGVWPVLKEPPGRS